MLTLWFVWARRFRLFPFNRTPKEVNRRLIGNVDLLRIRFLLSSRWDLFLNPGESIWVPILIFRRWCLIVLILFRDHGSLLSEDRGHPLSATLLDSVLLPGCLLCLDLLNAKGLVRCQESEVKRLTSAAIICRTAYFEGAISVARFPSYVMKISIGL